MRGTSVEVRLNTPDRTIDETITVKVPPGVDEGSKVRVRGKGQPGHGGPRAGGGGGRGDLIILTHVATASRIFGGRGAIFYWTCRCRRPERPTARPGVGADAGRKGGAARAGGDRGGGSSCGFAKKGSPARRSAGGDQYCRIVIQLPPGLTEAEKQQLAVMDQGHGFNPRKDVGW